MAYKNIGQLCLEKGLITQKQLEKALNEQKEAGILLGALLVKKGYVTSQDIVFLLAEQNKLLHEEKGTDRDESSLISNIHLTILDIVTTGISPHMGAEIAQIGLMNITGEKVDKKYTALVKTRRELSYPFKLLHCRKLMD